MINRISTLTNAKIAKSHHFFLYGNCEIFKNSFQNYISLIFSNHKNVVCKNFQESEKNITNNLSLFNIERNKIFLIKVTDSDLQKVEEATNRQTNDIFVFIDYDFRKTKKISAFAQKNEKIAAIGLFENSKADYINFLVNNYFELHNANIKISNKMQFVHELLEFVNIKNEDPIKILFKLQMLNETEISHQNINDISGLREIAQNFEPITFLRYLTGSMKYNGEKKIISQISNIDFEAKEIFEKALDLETFYKKNNLKSAIFIQHKFLSNE